MKENRIQRRCNEHVGYVASLEKLRSAAVLAAVLFVVRRRLSVSVRRRVVAAMAATFTLGGLVVRRSEGRFAATEHRGRRESDDCKRPDDLPKDHLPDDTHHPAEPQRPTYFLPPAATIQT